YPQGARIETIAGLHPAAVQILRSVEKKEQIAGDTLPQSVHNPPYVHQELALRGALVDGQSLVVTTGTGSGKTECFLFPIIGKLAIEAADHPERFRTPAVRALVLYPMNALVNDQLGRLRLLIGEQRVISQFKTWA